MSPPLVVCFSWNGGVWAGLRLARGAAGLRATRWRRRLPIVPRPFAPHPIFRSLRPLRTRRYRLPVRPLPLPALRNRLRASVAGWGRELSPLPRRRGTGTLARRSAAACRRGESGPARRGRGTGTPAWCRVGGRRGRRRAMVRGGVVRPQAAGSGGGAASSRASRSLPAPRPRPATATPTRGRSAGTRAPLTGRAPACGA